MTACTELIEFSSEGGERVGLDSGYERRCSSIGRPVKGWRRPETGEAVCTRALPVATGATGSSTVVDVANGRDDIVNPLGIK